MASRSFISSIILCPNTVRTRHHVNSNHITTVTTLIKPYTGTNSVLNQMFQYTNLSKLYSRLYGCSYKSY